MIQQIIAEQSADKIMVFANEHPAYALAGFMACLIFMAFVLWIVGR